MQPKFAELPFRNCLEIPDRVHTGTSMSRQKGQRGLGLQPRVGENYGLDATLTIFQTVSEGAFSEVCIQHRELNAA
jgi:hypothetical protein